MKVITTSDGHRRYLGYERDVNYLKRGKCTIDPTKASRCPETGKMIDHVRLGRAHAIMLFPSFGCPAVIQEEGPLTIFLLVNEELVDNWEIGQERVYLNPAIREKYQIPTQRESDAPDIKMLNRLILQMLFRPWGERKEAPERFKQPGDDHNLLPYPVTGEDIGYVACTPPKKVNLDEVLVLRDICGDICGHVRPSALNIYYEEGYQHVVSVTFFKHDLKEGFYNLTWMSLQPDTRRIGCIPSPIEPFEEPQDIIIQERTDKSTHQGFGSQFAETFQYQLDKTQPIESFHPIYVTKKEKLGIGHLTDVHFSSRQQAFKRSKRQVIPGADESLSPPIGDLVHTSLDSVQDILNQMGEDKEIDCIFITGDLIDYNLNLDPNKAEIQSDSQLWKALSLHRNKSRLEEDSHTQYIDVLSVYTILLNFYDTYQKPIYIISGNHDAYHMPFGISPSLSGRLNTGKILEGRSFDMKFNDGIPADHNLTFYEALLLYGPGYRDVLQSFNFNDTQADWFYLVFSPLMDFAFTYNKQSFTALNWGADEDFIFSAAHGGSTLPRANQSLTDKQVMLLESRIEVHERINGSMHSLFMHAPIVNYEHSVPLRDFQANQVHCPPYWDSIGENYTHYDCGSISAHRYYLYRHLVYEKNLTHVFSGHSHRSALYATTKLEVDELDISRKDYVDTILGFKDIPLLKPCDLQSSITHPSHEMYNLYTVKVNTKGYDVEQSRHPQQIIGDKTRLIVTGSAGPIPVKNHQGELGGKGLMTAHGSSLTFPDGKETLQLVKAKVSTAKPRFAAMMDYFDVVKAPIFQISARYLEPHILNISVNQDFSKYDFIESIQLIIYTNSTREPLIITGELKKTDESPLKYQLSFNEKAFNKATKYKKNSVYFLSIKTKTPHFKSNDFDLNPIATYCHQTPWLLRVCKQIIVNPNYEREVGGWRIEYKRTNERKFENCFRPYRKHYLKKWEHKWC